MLLQTNIVFGQPFDEERYSKGQPYKLQNTSYSGETNKTSNSVIKQCALEQDLSLWKAGDMTEVGEKGLTLRYALSVDAYIHFQNASAVVDKRYNAYFSDQAHIVVHWHDL